MKQREIPSTADDATALAFLARGLLAGESTWDLFAPKLRERLRNRWVDWSERAIEPDHALDRLFAEHAAETRPDVIHRVHGSWWARALQDESPAVQRAVLQGISSAKLRERLARDLDLDPVDLTGDMAASPLAVACLDLWSARLVGGLPRPDEDPLVIAALTALKPCWLYRLIHATGLAKRAFVRGDDSENPADPRFLRAAEPDVTAHPAEDRRSNARLGLVTVGRLLTRVEPHRVRWALQHLPYAITKVIRAEIEWMNPLPSAWFRGEQRMFEVALKHARNSH